MANELTVDHVYTYLKEVGPAHPLQIAHALSLDKEDVTASLKVLKRRGMIRYRRPRERLLTGVSPSFSDKLYARVMEMEEHLAECASEFHAGLGRMKERFRTFAAEFKKHVDELTEKSKSFRIKFNEHVNARKAYIGLA